jgi:hypothetical protein
LSTTLTDVLGDDAWRERALGLIFDPQATSGCPIADDEIIDRALASSR